MIYNHHHQVVYHTIPTSNHNWTCRRMPMVVLYIILFLHQTTTLIFTETIRGKLYIILFLHQTTTGLAGECLWSCCISYYSYIKPQLADGKMTYTQCCISYYSYIKPQPILSACVGPACCISYYSYIKPQHECGMQSGGVSCISYYSYIKPQPQRKLRKEMYVVYHTIPTSNHNL